MGQVAARSGSDALPPRLTLERLGAALAASVLLHAGALGSLELLAKGAGGSPASRSAQGLRVTLAPLSDAPAAAGTGVPRPPAAAAPGPPSSTAPTAGATYLTAAELDRRPEPISEIDPDYPADAPPGGGYLVVLILINERGGADSVEVLAAEPRGAFERAAVAAFAAGRYRPGEKNGRPVKSQMSVAVTFHAQNPAEMPGQPAPLPQPASAEAR